MQLRSRVLRAAAAAWLPHIHTVDCAICRAAEKEDLTVVPCQTVSSQNSPITRDTVPILHTSGPPSRISLMQAGLQGWLSLIRDMTDPHRQPVQAPDNLVFPTADDLTGRAVAEAVAQSNWFLARVLSVPPASLGEGGIEKQLLFQQTLLDFQAVLQSCGDTGLRFFLVCGTALGAHREGYFIPHDDDIDIGIFYDDLVALGRSCGGDAECLHLSSEIRRDAEASVGVQRLVSTLTSLSDEYRGPFLLFDTCGTVHKGLELRLMHLVTGVRLDVNVYYTSREPNVNAGAPFVWSATYYEQAEQRAHGMYRYKHTPFGEALQERPFCAKGESSTTLLVPPVSYLEEYFGPDWRTPKKYSYAEGLRGEYKNIIEE